MGGLQAAVDGIVVSTKLDFLKLVFQEPGDRSMLGEGKERKSVSRVLILVLVVKSGNVVPVTNA